MSRWAAPLGIGSLAVLLLAGPPRAYAQDAPSYESKRCRANATGTSSSDSLPEWRPPSNLEHGLAEFDHSVLVRFPPHVSSVIVELWGAGGGGGGGSYDTMNEGGAGGGGGASGAYGRVALAVTPVTQFVFIVGRGGQGGYGWGNAGPLVNSGAAGGDTSVCAGDVALVTAPGGLGGQAARTNGHGGVGGKGRATGRSDTGVPFGLNRRGNDGGNGMPPLFEYRGSGGRRGPSIAGTTQPPGAFGGTGGDGATSPDRPGNGTPGAAGSVLVSW